MNIFSNLIGQLTKSSSGLAAERQNSVFHFMAWLLGAGVLAMILYSFRWWSESNAFMNILTIFSLFILLGGASFVIGVLAGFLFGIPRIEARAPQIVNGESSKRNSSHIDNDNLVQISDWLTKILVGVGLTQIHELGPALESLAKYLGKPMPDDQFNEVVTIALTIYFLVLGFLISYLWTRLYFKVQLGQADKGYQNLYEEFDSVKEDLAQLKSEVHNPNWMRGASDKDREAAM